MSSSMTGYGQAKSKIGNRQCLVEIRSVNHRYLDFSVRLPSVLSGYETDLRQLVEQKLKRGKINVYVSWNGEGDSELGMDRARIKGYVTSLKRIAKELKLKSELSASDLVTLPNIFTVVSDRDIAGKVWPPLKRLIEKALNHIMQMREREGRRLIQDIEKRLVKMSRAVSFIQLRARKRPGQYRDRLEKRVQELSSGMNLSPEALAKEVALFADRADITEELVRLDHHLKFFRKTLSEQGEIGKRLDFIAQEMFRETNTIASKAGSFPIAKEVVAIKAELEKIREQVQNIE